MTISIRLMTEADFDAADPILMAAYGSRTRREALRRHLMLQPDGWLIALLDGVPVGVGGAVDYGPFCYIGMLAVHPSAQRRGVALALMQRLLAWVEARKCPVALLDASDAGAPLYTRLGFVVDDTVDVYGLGGADSERPDMSQSMQDGVALMRADDLAEVVAFDTPRFGANRGAVLASLLTEYPERVLLTRDATGRVTGFLFAQSRTIGPWSAATPEDGAKLLRRALALPYEEPPTILVPALNAEARAVVEAAGLRKQRSLRHMRLGGEPLLARRRTIYGQASFALG